MASRSSRSRVIPYPSRRPAIAYIFVNAFRINRRLNRPERSSSITEKRSGSSRNSTKHSSSTQTMPHSSQYSRKGKSSARSTASPVGLFGLQRNTMSGRCPAAASLFTYAVSSGTERAKPSSSFKSNQEISQPPFFNACSYSRKEGAIKSARFGRLACTIRKISSAAPFPQITFSRSMR